MAESSGAHGATQSKLPRLTVMDLSKPHTFIKPVKRINEGHDVPHFLTSRAYSDIGIFVMQLDTAMCPRKVEVDGKTQVKTWELGSSDFTVSGLVEQIQQMLKTIEAIIDEAPPDTGPRRFGNISFRRWHEILASRVSSILRQHVPAEILDAGSPGEVTAEDELASYLLGGFGSSQRLDFGTGHELSFLAFLGGLWKLGGFTAGDEISDDGRLERSIVLGVFEPYLNVIRRLVLTYSLEPAGSHGVWGLDDHFFLPYIFGSAQYSPAIKDGEPMPIEGSRPDAPSPDSVTKKNVVDRERKKNMYFAAIGFIYDVKTGPFWEHSPILFDISGIRTGWGKVNKGMIKMYNAEVLSKFPVVQHFNFGSLFSFERDPNAAAAAATVHTSNQPSSHTISVTGNTTGAPTSRQVPQEGTRAPWATNAPAATMANAPPQAGVATSAPWAKPTSAAPPQTDGSVPTRAPWATSGSSSAPAPGNAPTRAPWATGPR
ncbi:Serine/threonine-protein phosphatase 2A activator 1 [Pseudogymnoascus australis]